MAHITLCMFVSARCLLPEPAAVQRCTLVLVYMMYRSSNFIYITVVGDRVTKERGGDMASCCLDATCCLQPYRTQVFILSSQDTTLTLLTAVVRVYLLLQ